MHIQILEKDDEGTIIYESRAISRYLAYKTKSPLLPYDSALSLARFEQAAAIESANFDPFAGGIGREWSIASRSGAPINKAAVKAMATSLEEKLHGYERILSKSRYLAGDEITLADLFHLPAGARLAKVGVNVLEDKDKFPNIAR